MRRRGFLAGLLALPFVRPIARVAAAVKARLFPVVYVGAGLTGEATSTTVAEAFAKVAPGGTIYVLPGRYEMVGPIVIDKPGVSLVGDPGNRPVLTLADEPVREELT